MTARAVLSDRDVALADLIAHRLLELLDERERHPAAAGSKLVDAATLADGLGVSAAGCTGTRTS